MSKSIGPETPFEPASNCKYASQCLFLGECFEAFVIKTETGYAKQGLDSGLAYQVEYSTCGHPQAQKAREEAGPFLSSK
jgi:hypothetical protein